VTPNISNSSINQKIQQTISPALFARAVTKHQKQPYVISNHLKLIDRELLKIANGENKRLIIEAPPRHGKSELVSKYFPAWYLGTHPDKNVILCAYGDDFSRTWGEKARNLLEEHGPSMFAVSIDNRSKAKDEWRIDGFGGGMVCRGVGGQIVGRGADVLIVDDPIKDAAEADSELQREKVWQWWLATASSRLQADGACIIIMQRWHVDDLIGRLKKPEPDKPTDKWTVITLPAIAEYDDVLGRAAGEALWPEGGWDLDKLTKKKNATSTRWWQAQYQQHPSTNEKAEWPDFYFEDIFIQKDQWPSKFEVGCLALDPSKGKDAQAKKGDYSALVFLGLLNGTVYVDSDLERRPVSKMVKDSLDMHARHHPDGFKVETNSFQELLVGEFNRQQAERSFEKLHIMEEISTVKKEVRIQRLGPYLMNKEIKFLDTNSNRLLVHQLKEFPLGMHDDGPDALEMGIRGLHELSEAPVNDGLGTSIYSRRNSLN